MHNHARMLYVDFTLAAAKKLLAMGRPKEAFARLSLLLASPLRPADAVPVHALAARIELERDRFAAARRHLRTALSHDAENAELHYQLGIAFQDDPSGSDEHAARQFKKAARLDSTNVEYLAAYGLSLVRIDRIAAGVVKLQQAANLAPADGNVIERVILGLIEADRAKVAKSVLQRIQFAAAGQTWFEQLEARVQFELARVQQAQDRRVSVSGRNVLPFVRIAATTTTHSTTGGIVRRDAASWSGPHFGKLRAYRAEPG